MTIVQEYLIPKGTTVFEGRVAGGTGYQYFVTDPMALGVRQVGLADLLPQSETGPAR